MATNLKVIALETFWLSLGTVTIMKMGRKLSLRIVVGFWNSYLFQFVYFRLSFGLPCV